MKNVYVLGTSNTVRSDGYFSELKSSKSINIVGSCRVGDVPTAYFCSVINDINQVKKIVNIDIILIDTMINDVLMSYSSIISEVDLEYSYKVLKRSLESVLPNARLMFLNFMPPPVLNAPTLASVNSLRENIFPYSQRVNIFNCDKNIYFEDSDILHHVKEFNKNILGKIEKTVSNFQVVSGSGSDSAKVISLSKELLSIVPHRMGYFQTSLATVSAIKLKEGDTYQVSFNSKVRVLGLTFVASNDKNSSICIDIDGCKFAYSSSTKYAKPLIRFIPIDQKGFKHGVQSISIRYIKNSKIPSEYLRKKLPNQSLEVTDNESDGVLIDSITYSCETENPSYTIRYKTDKIVGNSKKKVFFDEFWPGFQYENDPIFGTFLREHYDFDVVMNREEADIVFVSWYSPDMPTHIYHKKIRDNYKGTFVYYTAEHDGAGLRKEQQVDFEIYDYVISHYRISSSQHIWMPNYLRKHGLNVFSKVNELYDNNCRLAKPKTVQFCYSNESCQKRNNDLHLLQSMIHVDCGGKLFNNMEGYLPRDTKLYISALSEYQFIMTYENSSFPGYTTEKLVEAYMAGSVPIYWGDPLVNDIWDENTMINVNKCDLSVFAPGIASESELISNMVRSSGRLPMPRASEFEKELRRYYLEQFSLIFS